MKRINTFFSIKLNINLFIYFNIEMHCVEGPHFASLCRLKTSAWVTILNPIKDLRWHNTPHNLIRNIRANVMDSGR